MITRISLKNFKCFKALEMPLARLTLLTGFNASGKSTTLQSILLMSQTLKTNGRSTELRLNGPLLRLGSPGDVINQDQSSKELEIGVSIEDADLVWSINSEERDERRVLRVAGVKTKRSQESLPMAPIGHLRLLPEMATSQEEQVVEKLRQIVYVSAVRRVDSDIFLFPEDPNPINADVGAFGEYAPWWFHHYDDVVVKGERCVQGVERSNTLRAQVNAWLNELFPGAEANAQPVPKTQLMRLELRTRKTEEWRQPSNTGYGLSYAFPVLVAGLCVQSDQMLIIDSPEAHLHPRGQARMGRFLAQAAASGLQVIIETHSDHVLNGVRIALKDRVLSPEDTAIYFFAPDAINGGTAPTVVSLSMDGNGNLSHWPVGFFDQSENDLANLAGWA